MISFRDLAKLSAVTVTVCCAVFICSLFLNYNMDLAGVKDEIRTAPAMELYQALEAGGTVTAGVSGGCLVLTAAVMLIFYIKNYIDSRGKELGILKAMGYSGFCIAKHFWVFGSSVWAGSVLGLMGAYAYMPDFYKIQNKQGLLPQILPQFHLLPALCMLVLPAGFFMGLSVLYAYFKMKCPVIGLLKEVPKDRGMPAGRKVFWSSGSGKAGGKERSFLEDLRKSTLRSRKILVFFIGFSAFCFSSMTQMPMAVKDLGSGSFSWMMISIGLILAYMTLFLSLSSVVKANQL